MQIRTDELIGLFNQLKEFSALKLNGDIKFKLYQNMMILQPHIEAYEKTQKDLIEQLGTMHKGQKSILRVKDPEDENSEVNPNHEKYQKQMEKINETTMDIDLIKMPDNLFEAKREIPGQIYFIAKFLMNTKTEKKEKEKEKPEKK